MLADVTGLLEARDWVQAGAALLTVGGLWLGAEATARFATTFARRIGVSDLVIGLTLVSLASSLPEILINVSAALSAADDIVAGNVIGSCFVQISFVLGLCAVFAGRLAVPRDKLTRDGSMVLVANIAMIWVVADGRATLLEGIVLTGAYAIYIGFLVHGAMATSTPAPTPAVPVAQRVETSSGLATWRPSSLLVATVLSVLVVWAVADILVGLGRSLGQLAGISDGVIGLWVGVGTTLPELAISLAAIARGASRLSIGNLLGSNVTDPLLSLGLGILAGAGLLFTDFAMTAALIWLGASIVAIGLLIGLGALGRRSGAILIVLYIIGQSYLALTQ